MENVALHWVINPLDGGQGENLAQLLIIIDE